MGQTGVIPLYRRVYQRFILEASIHLVIDKTTEEASILIDLSQRGAGILTHYPLKENEKVTVIIRVPNLFSHNILKESKVVWCKKIDENLWQGGLDFGENNKILFS